VITALADTGNTAEDNKDQVYFKLLIGGIVIGCGIGSVYCVMAGAMSDHTPATNRASAIGVFKLFRDSGYAIGGLLTGILADIFGGSFVATTLIVAALVGILVFLIIVYYREVGASYNSTGGNYPREEIITPFKQ
jgi:MFS family permease